MLRRARLGTRSRGPPDAEGQLQLVGKPILGEIRDEPERYIDGIALDDITVVTAERVLSPGDYSGANDDSRQFRYRLINGAQVRIDLGVA
jgi:hypothetical protein